MTLLRKVSGERSTDRHRRLLLSDRRFVRLACAVIGKYRHNGTEIDDCTAHIMN